MRSTEDPRISSSKKNKARGLPNRVHLFSAHQCDFQMPLSTSWPLDNMIESISKKSDIFKRTLLDSEEVGYLQGNPARDIDSRDSQLGYPLGNTVLEGFMVWSPNGLNNPTGLPYELAREQDLTAKTRISISRLGYIILGN